jgi:hypothetical protein
MKIVRYSIPLFISASMILIGCGDSAEKKTKEVKVAATAKPKKKSESSLFHVGNEYFSIPSPVQTALLIQKSGISYDKALLSNPKNTPHFSTKFQRSVNLGVFGADLGYVAIYEQAQDGMGFMVNAKKLADELGLHEAFDSKLMKRFEANMGHKDSVLAMVSEAYKTSDAFLKDNEREEIGVVILAGGFIEALYFSTTVAKNTNNEDIKKRIGEQKSTLENLIKLLQRHSETEEVTVFVDQLIELYYLYDDVKAEYVFKEPTTDAATKTTIINSETKITMSQEQLEAITIKVESVRKHIIG